MTCIVYREKRFNERDEVVIEHAVTITEEYMAQGICMTLRQLYYQMIARDLFPDSWIDDEYNRREGLPPGTKNTLKNYSRLSKLISDARLAGRVDWDAIEDRGRRPQRASEWDSVSDLMQSALAAFRLPRWENQGTYVELWVEKDALASVLWPVANRWSITLMVNKGYSSQSAMYTSAQRFRAKEECGCALTLLYVGDHDPSGEDMVRDIGARMGMFEVPDLDVRKIAITMPQIRRLRPPPNPAKVTDPRAKAYIAEHGDRSWEVDAIPPDMLVRLVDEQMATLISQAEWDAVMAREEKLKKELARAVKNIK